MKFLKRDESGRFVSKKTKLKVYGFIGFVVAVFAVGHFYVEPWIDRGIEEAKKVQAAFSNEMVAYADTGTTTVFKVTEKGIPPIMQRIAECESGGKQFNAKGGLIKNHNTDGTWDIGKYQINFERHFEQIAKLKLDVLTEAGNEAYAMYLYENQGTLPWSSSSKCWIR